MDLRVASRVSKSNSCSPKSQGASPFANSREPAIHIMSPHLEGAILPSPMARLKPCGGACVLATRATNSNMIKRLFIAGSLVTLFLGGVGYFNLVFKPKMIGQFMAKMKPPPATVMAERAGTKEWIDRVHSIGTLMAIQGIDVAPEVAGIVKDYHFESGQDVEKGAKLVELDTSVEKADLVKNQAVLLEANADLKRQDSLVKKD